jgi:protein associated with RNAse G/E
MAGPQITVRSLKYDMQVRRTWTCELVSQTGSLAMAVGVFEEAVKHPGLGHISRGTVSHEYYWTDKWQNVFRFHEPDGRFRNFYCNVAMPAVITDDAIEYVDLDIDVVVWLDSRYEVLDRDDFERNAKKYCYPIDVIEKAEQSLTDLIGAIEGRDFPFSVINEFRPV